MGPGKTWRGLGALELMIVINYIFHSPIDTWKVTVNNSPLKALVGDNVTIPCHVSGHPTPLNLQVVQAIWTLRSPDQRVRTVYHFESFRHFPIRPGTKMSDGDLRVGDASLYIPRVEIGDDGDYICSFTISPDVKSGMTAVHVSVTPQVALLPEIPVELGSERSVTCEVTKFYPEAAKIRWVKYSKGAGMRLSMDRATCFTVPEEDHSGMFNATSLLTVRPSSLEEDGDVYSCVVTHRSLENESTSNFTLRVTERVLSSGVKAAIVIPILLLLLVVLGVVYKFFLQKEEPKLSGFTGLDNLYHMQRSTLSWMVSDFKPRKISVRLYYMRVTDSERKEICTFSYSIGGHLTPLRPKGNNEEGRPFIVDTKPRASLIRKSGLCSVDIIPDIATDKGAELIVEVEHASLKIPLIQCLKLDIKHDIEDYIRASSIQAPDYKMHGEEVTLTCEIDTVHLEHCNITWVKEDLFNKKPAEVIYKDRRVFDPKYSHKLITVNQQGDMPHFFSTLLFKAQTIEDHIVKYTCRTRYPTISHYAERSHWMFITAAPVVEEITSRHAVHHVGHQMELSCRIHSFHPHFIDIRWYKGDEMIPPPDHDLCVDEYGLYRTASVLKYDPQVEDIGKTFRCKVDHHGCKAPEIREWTLEDLRQENSSRLPRREITPSKPVLYY